MTVLRIKLFATLRDRAGQNVAEVETPVPTTMQEVLTALAEQYPGLKESLPAALIAVNKQFALPDSVVHEQDEIALFPPVSGGAAEQSYPTYFAITENDLDIASIQKQLVGPDVGAIVSFNGFVRGQTERDTLPPQTIYLEYEAYSSMAEEKMAQIAREIWQRWPAVRGVAIVQRIGRLDVGDVTTFVACATGHRDQGGFEAARYGIDRLKEIVPVWKKEIGPDGSEWMEGSYRPSMADNE